MEQVVYLSHLRRKIVYLLVKWEEAITLITVFCAILAIALGMAWLFLKEMVLLYLSMGSSSCYFIGKKFWRFRRHPI